jgi:hypothetical protein
LKIVKNIFRGLYFSFLFIAILIILAAAAVRFSPYVQTQIAQRLATYASQKMGYDIKIGTAKLTWLHTISLGNVKVKDTHGTQMLDIEQLDMAFLLANLQDSANLNIDHIKLTKPRIIFEIDSLTGKQNLEEFINKINELTASNKPKNPKRKPQLFTIDDAEIVDGFFEYRQNQLPRRQDPHRFDETHFTIKNLNAKIENFLAVRDTIKLFVDLSGQDVKTGLPIHRLRTDFLYCKKSMVFNDLLAKFGESKIEKFVRLDYLRPNDLGHFFDRVLITANFDSTRIHAADAAFFVPSLKQYNDTWRVTGHMKGMVSNFRLSNANVHFGNNTHLNGTFAIAGLPNTQKLKMNLAMGNSHLQVSDLKPYVQQQTYATLQKMGDINLNGNFIGTADTFRTNANIETTLGKATADLSLKLKNNNENSEYQGHLILNDFKIGQLLGQGTQLENVSMDGNVKGTGLDVKSAILDVDGSFKDIRYRGYTYHNVYLQGKLQKELFEGFASSKDSNLVFNMKGIVDLRDGRENFNISGQLQRSNLKKLKITDEDLSLNSKFTVSFSGTNIDNIFGFARFNDLGIRLNNKHLAMDTLFVYSEKNGNKRDIIADSDLARAHFEGDFTPSVAIKDIASLASEYKAYFTNSKTQRNQYYKSKLVDTNKNYTIDYSLNLLDAQPILSFFEPNVYLSDYSNVEGTFKIGRTVIFNAEAKVDTLRMGNYWFYNSNIDINTSKFIDSPDVLASGIVISEKQKLSLLAPTETMVFEGAWDKDRIVFDGGINQQNSTNSANLSGNMQFTETGIDLQFKRSSLTLLDKKWNVNPQNQISINGNALKIKNMTVENSGQILALNGVVSPDSTETLRVNTINFNLASIAPILDTEISGTLNANAILNNIYGKMAIEGEVKIDSLVYKKIWIGNLAGTNTYDRNDHLLNIHYAIDRDSLRVMTLEGVYLPENKNNSLDLLANLNATSLVVLEPFTQEIFSKFEGTANGQIHITGSPTVPKLDGAISLEKGKAQIDYLKAQINFDDKVIFGNNQITTNKLRLTDTEGHIGQLQGGAVYNDGFKNFQLNLLGSFNNFKILNTTAKDNDTFYGTAYATGNMSITGPLDNIYIKAKAASNKGTKIYIPLDGTTQVSNADYIEYITTLPNTAKKTTDSLGISTETKRKENHIAMDFTLNITPDAYCELQLDRQSGDIIKAYGAADLNMKVNTRGDFSMTGVYELDKGDYSFNFETFVTKNFKILPKSKIVWSGDPLEADLDITAEYTQYTSLQPIFPAGSLAANTNLDLNRKYPVSVLLKLKNRMLSPTVTYDIDFKDYPRVSDFTNNVLAFKNRISTNEQELGIQVGSLLLAQRLSEQQSADALKLQNFTSNIAEYLTNQVGKLASGENFQFGINSIDYSTLSENLINSMQLQFSYNFDDRLRINHMRSNILGNNSQNSSGDNSYLIGDWSLEWLITKDGRLRLKGYNRNTPNVFQSISLTNYITSYGASLVYTKSFNRFFRAKEPPKPADKDLVMQNP